ncbi:MAG: hypothetical protein CMC08_00190 [Flavobacteriaceae bacterium]|nr:hypothetical protein [Flavobacteriaceae bacterium]
MKTTQTLGTKTIGNRMEKAFRSFILEADHPCIMAQTVFTMDDVSMLTFPEMGTQATTASLYAAIEEYLQEYDFESNTFKTLIAVFPKASFATEEEFEIALWAQLQQLHNIDSRPWDDAVSTDPDSSEFSFSIAGKAFYIVGMHPNSSRKARQAPYPTIVFNLHWQFEKLRDMGTYANVRDKIRERDEALQGSINPVLRDFGEDSEAKQYSGRHVSDQWKCPFHPQKQ